MSKNVILLIIIMLKNVMIDKYFFDPYNTLCLYFVHQVI